MRHIIQVICFLLLFPLTPQAQTPDTLSTQALPELTVQGFADEGSSADVAGSVGVLSDLNMRQANPSSPAFAFNQLSGVRLEQRAEGSYRFAIRGSALRSPYGVRNVKFYWNGIPFTEASGRTHLNTLDMASFQQAEVIKGPAGSLFGAGAGGVVRLNTFAQTRKATASANITTGTDAYAQQQLQLHQQTDEQGWNVLYSRRKSDGYREQNFLDRHFFQLSHRRRLDEKTEVSFHSFYSNLSYGVPGGLNQEQFNENPQQARPGSIDKGVAVYHDILLAGATIKRDLGEHWQNTTTLYTWFGDFEMPFLFNYDAQQQLEGGGRTAFQWENRWGKAKIKAHIGGEWQRGGKEVFNYGNVGGQPDTLRFADDLRTDQWLLFAQGQLLFPSGLKIEAGLSYNQTQIDLHRLTDQQQDTSFQTELSFEPILAPRLAVSYPLLPKLRGYMAYSYGYSIPTLDEIRTDDLFINQALQPEKLHNIEMGFKWRDERLQADLTLFTGRLEEAITSYALPNSPYTRFQNAGQVRQRGLELQLLLSLVENKGALSHWQVSAATTAYQFQFRDYQDRGNDFSGNTLPGIPDLYQTLGTQIRLRSGLYAGIQGFYSSSLQLNSANTAQADAYLFANACLGWEVGLGGLVLDLHVRGYNIGDSSFSLGNDINAFGNRYFQPAPHRRFYAGVSVQWKLGA